MYCNQILTGCGTPSKKKNEKKREWITEGKRSASFKIFYKFFRETFYFSICNVRHLCVWLGNKYAPFSPDVCIGSRGLSNVTILFRNQWSCKMWRLLWPYWFLEYFATSLFVSEWSMLNRSIFLQLWWRPKSILLCDSSIWCLYESCHKRFTMRSTSSFRILFFFLFKRNFNLYCA